MAGRVDEGLYHQDRVPPPTDVVARQAGKASRQHRRGEVRAARVRQHAVALVVHDVAQAPEVQLVWPADQLLSRRTRKRCRAEADQRGPGPVRADSDVAHGLADEVVAKPVMAVQRFVEALALVGADRADRHRLQVGVWYPPASNAGRGWHVPPVPGALPGQTW